MGTPWSRSVSGVWPHGRLEVYGTCGTKGPGLPFQDPGFCQRQEPVARGQ